MSVDLEIEAAGERVLLLPERAVYWPKRETLLIADTHWGKAATMRAASIPIPAGTTGESLERLMRVLERTRAKRIVLLGDCLHARNGRSHDTLAEIAAWRKRYSAIDVELVRGNHDRHAGDPPVELDMKCVDAPKTDPPFVYRHFPKASNGGYTLAGHLHPAIRLYGDAAERATAAKDRGAPLQLVRQVAADGRLPVVLFCAGGIATFFFYDMVMKVLY